MSSERLRQLVLEITDACNLHCHGCYSRAMPKVQKWVDPFRVDHLVHQAAGLGTRHFVISGGEPVLDVDTTLVAVRSAKALGMQTTMTSNGTLLDDALLARLQDAGLDKLQISLDGPDAYQHERRRGAGTFERAVRAVNLARLRGISVSVMTVPEWKYIYRLKQFLPLLTDLGIRVWGIERPVPFGGNAELDYRFDNHRLRDFHDRLLCLEAQAQDLKIHCNDPLYNLRRLLEQGDTSVAAATTFAHEFGLGCSAGHSALVIGADGGVRGCTFLPQISLNVRDASLFDVWNDLRRYVDQLRVAYGGQGCQDCQYHALCRGCPAQSLVDGSKQAASRDPACYLFQLRKEVV
uniref:Radical SAM additional 4Fe4S-binding SPASM domain-containing protein n=1 Tax=Candidatus Kentrum sp. UNK TaxID=2126344 RepID=A0A451AF45_9GAMM|nr:MAG: radical SAM additional 4Fe4S-binding SPASM domain-containing protein [Candidatus Kentron sp. UNK]VFK71166.1 MAG: radical SAM additional 4Fe4S-binding SPASM domain-containing protein [Candidatus Kentron sp. UNK]